MIGYIQRAKTALFIAIILNCGTAWSGTQDEVPPLDYLSFAQGAIPVAVGGEPLAPVSYTHLRAHETVLDLVCRLLLEKKKN